MSLDRVHVLLSVLNEGGRPTGRCLAVLLGDEEIHAADPGDGDGVLVRFAEGRDRLILFGHDFRLSPPGWTDGKSGPFWREVSMPRKEAEELVRQLGERGWIQGVVSGPWAMVAQGEQQGQLALFRRG